MRNRVCAVVGALLLGGLAAPAQAQDAATLSEVRCLIVAATMLGSEQEELATPGLMAFLYFLGRVEGRLSDQQLEDTMRREAARMSGEQLQANAMRCGDIMKERGAAVEAIGRNLMEGAIQQ